MYYQMSFFSRMSRMVSQLCLCTVGVLSIHSVALALCLKGEFTVDLTGQSQIVENAPTTIASGQAKVKFTLSRASDHRSAEFRTEVANPDATVLTKEGATHVADVFQPDQITLFKQYSAFEKDQVSYSDNNDFSSSSITVSLPTKDNGKKIVLSYFGQKVSDFTDLTTPVSPHLTTHAGTSRTDGTFLKFHELLH